MKHFLFVSDWINPFEPSFGGAQRSNLLLRAILKHGDVDVIAFANGLVSNMEGCKVLYSHERHVEPYVSRIDKLKGLFTPWKPNAIYPVDKEKAAIVDGFVSQKHYDAIVVRYVPEAMSIGLMKYADKLIIDVDDHPKDTLRNMAKKINSKPKKMYHYIASLCAPILVRSISNKVKATLFPNLQQVVGRNGYFLPNVPFDEPQTEFVDFQKTLPRLFFVGWLDHRPNYLGVDWFVDNVWPNIKKTIPNAEFHVGGKVDPNFANITEPYLAKWRAIDGITVLGYIEDINKEYDACRATISPIFLGAGTNIKLVESMQRKRVCITTDCGMRGMNSFMKRGDGVLVSSKAKEYASLCIEVLTDETLNHQIAKKAYSVMEQYFSHNSFNNIVAQIMSKFEEECGE